MHLPQGGSYLSYYSLLNFTWPKVMIYLDLWVWLWKCFFGEYEL